MAEPPPAVIRAARALALDPGRLRHLGGASAFTWAAGDQVLRVGQRDRMRIELAAAATAARVLPVPRVLGRAEVGGHLAVVLERLPGRPAIEVALRDLGAARLVGEACAGVHAVLAEALAPAGLPPVPDGPTNMPPVAGPRLLHLDLHPFNLLASDDGELTGVLDWANAAAGHPSLDRARTWSILTLDPAAVARQADPAFAALASTWIETAHLAETPGAARAWACRYMLNDLSRRYSPGALAHVHEAYERLRQRTASM